MSKANYATQTNLRFPDPMKRSPEKRKQNMRAGIYWPTIGTTSILQICQIQFAICRPNSNVILRKKVAPKYRPPPIRSRIKHTLPYFLVGAFLEKRVDYRHGFSSVFFLRPPELTKIVLPKVLQNFKFHLLVQGTEPKSFPHNIQCRTRPKGPPFQFFRHCETFFRKKIFPKGSPLQFFWVLRQPGYRKIPKGLPFQFFLAL